MRVELPCRDSLGLSTLLYGGFEAAEIAYLSARVERGSVVIDVGANVGLFTVALAGVVGPSGKVLAVEPNPATVSRLRKNVSLNHLTNVEIHSVAAGVVQGVGTLLLASDPAFASTARVRAELATGEAVRVPVARIDDMLLAQDLGRVSVIKIDVEGDELAVLGGSEEILGRCGPMLLVEANSEPQLRGLVEWLGARGYKRRQPLGFEAWNHLFEKE